ncbi:MULTISPECIES: hypothetical protein [unclassified Streptomyces]|uniref:hypothetical protein n=1 Tax=unclassified Streptomyces TaxID=2593676 RepID=UPI002E365760|nr:MULTISPECIES: hypothetical protein [unclassified Streptomyces]WUC69143.1 hypothetical protein OG861_33410 [Streptomyces sp. NBC_00539]
MPEFELPGWSHSAYENDILVVLTGFALTMIACDLIFLWRALDRLIGRVRSRRDRTAEPAAAAEETRDKGAVHEAELV